MSKEANQSGVEGSKVGGSARNAAAETAALAAGEAAKAAVLRLVGDEGGVKVEVTDAGYAVTFPYDRELSGMLAKADVARFDKEAQAYMVPLESGTKLASVVSAMRRERAWIGSDLDEITLLATSSALNLQHASGAAPDVVPQVSSFIEPGKFYRGQIVNANTRFAAQATGFGKNDGAAFVQIHRLADVPGAALLKGDSVAISYDDKFRGHANTYSPTKSAEALAADFEAQKGQVIDGVMASDRGDKIGVSFDFNSYMAARIRRVEGAVFHKEDKVWEIPKDKMEFALYAISDLRNEFQLDSKERGALQAVAAAKIDNPVLHNAFTRDGAAHYGVVLEVGERYALQSSGRGNFNLHQLSSLDQMPAKGADVKIQYNKGVGAVLTKQVERGAGVGR
jgi:hypothetical protein